MAFGSDVLEIAETRLRQRYVFGARAPLDNPNWQGPWDCAEYVSWCVYQAYGLIFGAGRVSRPSNAEPYSGYWYDDARNRGTPIAWERALDIRGAVLVRRPTPGKIGHVAFSLGDGDRTMEARGAQLGVNIFTGARRRPWSLGCLLPGVNYDGDPGLPDTPGEEQPQSMPDDYFWLKTPNIKSPAVVSIQRALMARTIDPGPIDGEFGPLTQAAVVAFQLVAGLEVDGIVGPSTSGGLGLAFPIVPTSHDKEIFLAAQTPNRPGPIVLPSHAGPSPFDGIVAINRQGNVYKATAQSGRTFRIGSTTSFTDDAVRFGLMQRRGEITDSLQFGVYDARAFKPVFGAWAHFIEPTLNAEGGARFAALNTYDRAAFTFGAPQLAAHTPNENFVEYFREVLDLDNAPDHFPELKLRLNSQNRKTIHFLGAAGPPRDLEEVVLVTRPNGRREKQLAHLMAYLNPSSSEIDSAEVSAAARLMNWLALDPRARELQIKVFIKGAKGKLEQAQEKVDGFDGRDWRIALWIMDILHQGRGSYREMTRALRQPNPEAALMRIGSPTYNNRIEAVAGAMTALAAGGEMNGFSVFD